MYRQDISSDDQRHLPGKPLPDAGLYLQQIGISKPVFKPSVAYLKKLQRNHLLHVPFENLDIQYFRKIELNIVSMFKKVMLHKHGGYCYELNALFHWLLQKEGFSVEMISARVYNSKGILGPEFDHLALVVSLVGKKYLVDVGFGDFSTRPLLIENDLEQKDDNGVFVVRNHHKYGLVVQKKQGRMWKPQYVFSLKPHVLLDFADMHHYHQTSPESLFTQKRICSLMTKKGRITITNNRLIISDSGKKSQHTIHSENEFNQLLEKYFGFRMDD